jgi:hypothetical protein
MANRTTIPLIIACWAVIAGLAVAYAIACAHGVVTIDVARDLYWGQQIVRGDAFPLAGPPIGSATLLGPIWYYVVAVVLSISGSLTAYFGLMGLLAASKFALAFAVGRRWLGPAFGVSLAVASVLPGVASYQMLGTGHPWFVEAALWFAAWCALRLIDTPEQMRWAAGLGVAAALALHAHPTVVLILPWALVAIFRLPNRRRWTALLVSSASAIAVFTPLLVVKLWPSLAANSLPDNAVGPSGLGGSMTGFTSITRNLLWSQPKNFFDSLLPHTFWGANLLLCVWLSLLVVTLVGSFLAWRSARLRGTVIGSLATLTWTIIALTLLRDHTPFYMMFVALLPLSVFLAVSWLGMRGSVPRFGHAVWVATLTLVGGMHVVVAAGLTIVARTGLIDSYLPLHSNMQDTSTFVHNESFVAAPTRDALARWLCTRGGSMSLHGDIAAAFDMGLRHETNLACPAQRRRDDVGGNRQPHVGLPQSVWKELTITPFSETGAYGLVPVKRVILPMAALAEVTGRRYPPRFEMMLAATNRAEWSVTPTLPGSEMLIVSSLLPTFPFFAVTASANGILQTPVATFANTYVFRCEKCAAADVRWEIKVRGGLPEATSITSVLR